MVVRILHEGQFDLADDAMKRLDEIDDRLYQSVVASDEGLYRRLYEQVLQIIRQGRPLASDDLRPSDLVLPAPDSTLAEVRELFRQEGLIDAP